MKINLTAMAAIVVITAITLWTSIEHHRSLVGTYGPIANIYVPIVTISSFLLGAAISFMFQWGVNEIQFDKVARLLPEADGRVMKVLFDRRKINQSELSSDAGVSRSMIHRIISRLESRGVISKRLYDNRNVIESQVYRAHPLSHTMTMFPGLTENRLLASIAAVFLFGISLSMLNSYHVLTLKHPLELSLYLLAMEFFALGGFANILLRKKISDLQFEKTIGILPEDEKDVLRLIHRNKATTQMSLTAETGMNKMKISRIIRKFEQRGIIDKKPHGYTNRIISKI